MNYLKMNDEKLLPVVLELNTLLADYHIYYQKLRNFHWNILGKNFFELHQKFEEMYSDARVKIDEIAERILTLRFHPISRYSEYLEIADVKEVSPLKSDEEMVAELIKDHSKILAQLRVILNHAQNAKDEGTVDLMGGYIREVEKYTWMLSAWSKESNQQLDTTMVNAM